MYTATFTDTAARMPTNGRGGTAVARVITDATVAATSPTSVTVNNLGANVAVGDILFPGQGNWGVATAVAGNVVSVKRWYRLGGGVGTLPPSGGTLVAFPGGVLRSAVASIIEAVVADTATDSLTLTDALGTTVAIALPYAGAPIKMWGPWRGTAGAATVTATFRTVGDLDT